MSGQRVISTVCLVCFLQVAFSAGMVSLEGLSQETVAVLDQATRDTEQFVEKEQDKGAQSDAWGRLGMLYHAHHLPFGAEESYSKAIAARDNPRWRYLRAVAMSERGELEGSLADYRAVTRAHPDAMPAWYRLGAGLMIKGDHLGAELAFKAALELAPDAPIVLMGLADVASAKEDWSEALKLLTRAREQSPDAGQLAYKLAMVNRRLGDVEKAREWLAARGNNNATPAIDDPLLLEVAQLSVSGRFYMKAGEWAMARNDLVQALDAYSTAVRLMPEHVDAGLSLAYVQALQGREAEALHETRRILKVDERSARAWYTLAWLLRRSVIAEEVAEALLAIDRSLAITETEQTRALAAALAMRNGLFERAVADYRSLISEDQEQAYYHYWLGVALLAADNCQGVLSLNRATQLRSNWGEAHRAMARGLALCGNVDAARERAQALLKARDDLDNRITLGIIALVSGDVELGTRIARAALPHEDAKMLIDALETGAKPTLFARDSESWLPPEVR